MASPKFSDHARTRMRERNITETDVWHALSRRSGNPEPASPGKNWVFGYAPGNRILKVLLTADEMAIVTVVAVDR